MGLLISLLLAACAIHAQLIGTARRRLLGVAPATAPIYVQSSMTDAAASDSKCLVPSGTGTITVTAGNALIVGMRMGTVPAVGALYSTSLRMSVTDTQGDTFVPAGAYFAGSIAVISGSAAVVGTGTAFTSDMAGRWTAINDHLYTILSVSDATHLTLVQNINVNDTGTWSGGDGTEGSYRILGLVSEGVGSGTATINLFIARNIAGGATQINISWNAAYSVTYRACGLLEFSGIGTTGGGADAFAWDGHASTNGTPNHSLTKTSLTSGTTTGVAVFVSEVASLSNTGFTETGGTLTGFTTSSALSGPSKYFGMGYLPYTSTKSGTVEVQYSAAAGNSLIVGSFH